MGSGQIRNCGNSVTFFSPPPVGSVRTKVSTRDRLIPYQSASCPVRLGSRSDSRNAAGVNKLRAFEGMRGQITISVQVLETTSGHALCQACR